MFVGPLHAVELLLLPLLAWFGVLGWWVFSPAQLMRGRAARLLALMVGLWAVSMALFLLVRFVADWLE